MEKEKWLVCFHDGRFAACCKADLLNEEQLKHTILNFPRSNVNENLLSFYIGEKPKLKRYPIDDFPEDWIHIFDETRS